MGTDHFQDHFFEDSCAGLGREEIFRFNGDPDTEGVLLAWTESSADVYTRKDCLDPLTETSSLECRIELAERLAWVDGDEPVSIFVDSEAGEEGPFTLHVAYTNANEQCALAEAAVLGDNSGNVTAQPPRFELPPVSTLTLYGYSLFEGSCGGSAPSPEKAFSFTPEISGTLTADVATFISGLSAVVYIRTNCLDTASEVACENKAYDELGRHTRVTADVVGGVPLTIFVDFSSNLNGDDFTLNVALAPS